MTYILGMAKSPLDLRGAKARNLRLDIELLARGLASIRAGGDAAVGYLLVLTEGVAARARGWDVVTADPALEVLVATLSETDMLAVQAEKLRNAAGTRSGVAADSIAALGQRLGEDALRRAVRARHPGAQLCSAPSPLGVRWDFYGIAS